MEMAMDQYMAKPALSRQTTDVLQQYKSEIVWAVSSEELMRIVHKTIDLMAAVSRDIKYTDKDLRRGNKALCMLKMDID